MIISQKIRIKVLMIYTQTIQKHKIKLINLNK